jgi:hypothetical protein
MPLALGMPSMKNALEKRIVKRHIFVKLRMGFSSGWGLKGTGDAFMGLLPAVGCFSRPWSRW